MNLLQELKKIEKLNGKTLLKVSCTDGEVVEGLFRGYVSELDNEPEIPQLELQNSVTDGLVGIMETEIKYIEVIN